MKFKSSPRSLHIRWSVNPKNHPMKHLPLCYSFERLMDMDSLVFTYPQRSAVNEAETCTFAPKHLLDEQGQWDGYLFSNSTKRLYETTLGKRWRIYFHIFPDKNILDNDIPNHKKVSWSTWFLPLTGLKYRVCALYGGFKRIFCHHCIKKFAETISHTK